MELETVLYISVGMLGGACALLSVAVLGLCCQVRFLKKGLTELQHGSRLRVQKAKLDTADMSHAFNSATLSPDEELSRRGYSMYVGDDPESGRAAERQTGGQFVEELSRELEHRQSRQWQEQRHEPRQEQSQAPPFLLQAIQENKRLSRSLANPVANGRGRASETNPNFIY